MVARWGLAPPGGLPRAAAALQHPPPPPPHGGPAPPPPTPRPPFPALWEPIRAFAARRPVWGTCAGMIVMAKRASDLDRETLGLMDIEVVRNAFGRQVDSFETDIAIDDVPGPPGPAGLLPPEQGGRGA